MMSPKPPRSVATVKMVISPIEGLKHPRTCRRICRKGVKMVISPIEGLKQRRNVYGSTPPVRQNGDKPD